MEYEALCANKNAKEKKQEKNMTILAIYHGNNILT